MIPFYRWETEAQKDNPVTSDKVTEGESSWGLTQAPSTLKSIYSALFPFFFFDC